MVAPKKQTQSPGSNHGDLDPDRSRDLCTPQLFTGAVARHDRSVARTPNRGQVTGAGTVGAGVEGTAATYVETYGRERVRAKLEAERLWLDLQFNPVAIWRYMQEDVLQRPEDDPVKQEWNEVLRLAHEISPRLPVKAPSIAAD